MSNSGQAGFVSAQHAPKTLGRQGGSAFVALLLSAASSLPQVQAAALPAGHDLASDGAAGLADRAGISKFSRKARPAELLLSA